MCKSILRGGSAPAPVVLPPVTQQAPAQVQEGDSAVTQARDNERKRRLAAAGANNTLVTGGAGLINSANTGGGQALGA